MSVPIAYFCKCFPFNLADTVTGYVKMHSDFFKGTTPAVGQPPSERENLYFPHGQAREEGIFEIGF